VAGVLAPAPVALKGPVGAGGWVAETQQIHPAHRAGLDPRLGGDPGPQRRGLVPARRRRGGWGESGGAGGLGLDGELDRVPEPAGLDLNIEGEPAGEPVGVQQHEQPGGELDQPELLAGLAGPDAVGGGGHRRPPPRA
jgi:hypothetical protein